MKWTEKEKYSWRVSMRVYVRVYKTCEKTKDWSGITIYFQWKIIASIQIDLLSLFMWKLFCFIVICVCFFSLYICEPLNPGTDTSFGHRLVILLKFFFALRFFSFILPRWPFVTVFVVSALLSTECVLFWCYVVFCLQVKVCILAWVRLSPIFSNANAFFKDVPNVINNFRIQCSALLPYVVWYRLSIVGVIYPFVFVYLGFSFTDNGGLKFIIFSSHCVPFSVVMMTHR